MAVETHVMKMGDREAVLSENRTDTEAKPLQLRSVCFFFSGADARIFVFLPDRTSATWALPENPHFNIESIVDSMPDLHVGFALQAFFGSRNFDCF